MEKLRQRVKTRLEVGTPAYVAARALYRLVERARQAAEALYVKLRFGRGGEQSARWNGYLISERLGDPYVPGIVFGRMEGFEVQKRLLHRFITPRDAVALDIGANIGMISLLLLATRWYQGLGVRAGT